MISAACRAALAVLLARQVRQSLASAPQVPMAAPSDPHDEQWAGCPSVSGFQSLFLFPIYQYSCGLGRRGECAGFVCGMDKDARLLGKASFLYPCIVNAIAPSDAAHGDEAAWRFCGCRGPPGSPEPGFSQPPGRGRPYRMLSIASSTTVSMAPKSSPSSSAWRTASMTV